MHRERDREGGERERERESRKNNCKKRLKLWKRFTLNDANQPSVKLF